MEFTGDYNFCPHRLNSDFSDLKDYPEGVTISSHVLPPKNGVVTRLYAPEDHPTLLSMKDVVRRNTYRVVSNSLELGETFRGGTRISWKDETNPVKLAEFNEWLAKEERERTREREESASR